MATNTDSGGAPARPDVAPEEKLIQRQPPVTHETLSLSEPCGESGGTNRPVSIRNDWKEATPAVSCLFVSIYYVLTVIYFSVI